MALMCARGLLPTIVAQIIQQLGWDAVHQSVLDCLVDILDRHLANICKKVHFFAELDGRADPDLDDLHMAFRDLGVNLHDIVEYVSGVDPATLVVNVPSFPANQEMIKAKLTANKPTVNGDLNNHTEEQRMETDDGSRTVVPTTPGGVTTPGLGQEKKPFSNDAAATKRIRSLPDDALHSQYEMKSFLSSDSGTFIPIRRGIKASTRCASPPTPKRPAPMVPSIPTYTGDKVDSVQRAIFMPDPYPLVNKVPKKSKKLPKDALHKIIKPAVKKPKKLPSFATPGHVKLPKPLKVEKPLVKKSRSSSGGKKLGEPPSRGIDKLMHQMFPEDVVKVEDDVHIDKELQRSRIRSYEDSINTVVLQSSQDGAAHAPMEFRNVSPLALLTKPSFADDRENNAESFYKDLEAPVLLAELCKFDDGSVVRDSDIVNVTEEEVIDRGLDDDLRLSPEAGDSDAEGEPKQTAVEDIFDVSGIPSPKIPTTWPDVEEEVIKEPMILERDEFVMPRPSSRVSSPPPKKSRKSKLKSSEKFGNSAFAGKDVEERGKKSKRRSVERSSFGFDSQPSWSMDDWNGKLKHPADWSDAVVEPPAVSLKSSADWDKKSKSRPSDMLFLDFTSEPIKNKHESEKKPKHKPDYPFIDLENTNSNNSERKSKHHRVSDEHAVSHRKESEDKKSKRSDRTAANSMYEPPRDILYENVSSFGQERSLSSEMSEWPKVRLETIGSEDVRRDRLKRSLSRSPSPALPAMFTASSGVPFAVPTVLDVDDQRPLKRIKIVSSVGSDNHFEIKPSELAIKPDKKEKKKAKKKKDRDRSRDLKDRDWNHDHRDHDQSRSRERSNDHKGKDKIRSESETKRSSFEMPMAVGSEDSFLRKPESAFVPAKTISPVFDWTKTDGEKKKQPEKSSSHRLYEDKPSRDRGERHTFHDKNNLSVVMEKPVSKVSLSTFDEKFTVAAKDEMQYDWLNDKSRESKSEYGKLKSRDHKKKDKLKYHEDGRESRKEEKHKGEHVKRYSEHKKKKSEKKHEKEARVEEMAVDPGTAPVASLPKLTLKLGGAITRVESPAQLPTPVARPPPPPEQLVVTNPPIKLRFKNSFISQPPALPTPTPARQSFITETPRIPPAKIPLRTGHASLLDMPTFSPSPESISIPSAIDSSDGFSDREFGRRALVRTPTPPSLSIPAPIVQKTHLPYYNSSSSSSNHSLSPPLLHLPQDVNSHQGAFSVSSRKSATSLTSITPVLPKSDHVNLFATPANEFGSKSSAAMKSGSKTSQKSKSSTKVNSSPKSHSHSKGLPPSKIMPPATPVHSLLPSPAKSVAGKSGGGGKSKKRVTTETVSKVTNEDGVVITWICPACLLEDKGEEPMIGCDGCDDWYHWRCVGIIVEPPEEIPWYCQRCQSKSKPSAKASVAGKGKGKKAKRK